MTQTIDYLRAQLHRAQNQGDKTLTIACLDLQELIASLQSVTDNAKNHAVGQHAGWCRAADLRGICGGQRFRITMRRKKNEEFNTSVCFKELPPIVKEVIDETETSVSPEAPLCEPPVSGCSSGSDLAP